MSFNELRSQASYFAFVMGQFGLQRLIPRVVINRPLDDETNQEAPSSLTHTDRGVYNMHTGDSEPPVSVLGTPVFADAKFKNADGELHLLWVLFDVQMTKNIIKTQPLGRDGTVKEYINDGDYSITIRGAFTDTFKVSYPKAFAENMIKLLKSKKPLEVTSKYLQMFGIYNLVVEDYRMGQQEGRQNIQWFEITCSSDETLNMFSNQQLNAGASQGNG
ncbi:DUF6046 domain-containing protein [Niabella sp. 22666]|uniref:DUF6046 domain-containing protein n=1 Tax=Niabella sp. 22666 TaxID=3453954 RepID=UPI003F878F57